MKKKIIIENDIFDICPDFYRGIVIVSDITNHPSYNRIRKILKKEIDQTAAADLSGDARIDAWSDVHRKFGSTPETFPPSILSLVTRIKANPALPYINSAVALFNYISLKYRLPCGGDDVDRIEGNLVLGRARGNEKFIALGSDTEVSPEPGEVIYYDSATHNVMCRRWNWRNGDQTKILPETKKIVINIDCLPPTDRKTGESARDELAELLQVHCQAKTVTGALHSECREFELVW
jgi:DNA/RNA-binding domain of Phe-tRNA-synthetase-like protein